VSTLTTSCEAHRFIGMSTITATTASPNPRIAATKSDILGIHQGRLSLAASPAVQTRLQIQVDGIGRPDEPRDPRVVRMCHYSKSTKGHAELVASTCRTTVDGVATSFIAADKPDPQLDSDGKTSFL